MNNPTDNNEFDIVDFDLNEYDEELKKDEERLQQREQKKEEAIARLNQAKEQAAGLMDKRQRDPNDPNRDMLKTILSILGLIVLACLFLGVIAYVVNHVGGDGKKDRDKITTEASTTDWKDLFNKTTEQTGNTQDDQKQNLEDNIGKITDKVKEDQTTAATTEAPTTEAAATTEATEAPTTEEATTEAPTTEATTEAPTTETTIDAQPEE